MKLKKRLKGIFLFSFFSFLGCERPIKTISDIRQYVNDSQHGLIKHSEVNEIQVSLTYEPSVFISSIENHRQDLTNAKEATDSGSTYLYFLLSLSKGGHEFLYGLPFKQYSEYMEILSFGLKNALKISDKFRSYPVAECAFAPSFGRSTANNILLVFEKGHIEESDEFEVVVQECGLGLGNLHFHFNAEDIMKLKQKLG